MKKKCHNICYFSHQMCFLFNVIFFIWKRSRHSKNCIAYSEKFILSKTCQNCYTVILCIHFRHVWWWLTLIYQKRLLMLLKSMKTLNLIFSYEKYKLNTFRWCIYNFSKNWLFSNFPKVFYFSSFPIFFDFTKKIINL